MNRLGGTRISLPHYAVLLWVILCLFWPLSATAQDANDGLETYYLRSKGSSYMMSSACPANGMDLFFTLSHTKGGSLFDTCGIGAADEGDWKLMAGGDGSLSFWIFSPNVRVPSSESNGWVLYKTDADLELNESYAVLVEVDGYNLGLVVYTQDEENPVATFLEGELPCALTSKAVFAGDYPGDNSMGEHLGVRRSAIAEIGMIYFGPVIPDFEDENLKKTWVIPGSGAKPAE